MYWCYLFCLPMQDILILIILQAIPIQPALRLQVLLMLTNCICDMSDFCCCKNAAYIELNLCSLMSVACVFLFSLVDSMLIRSCLSYCNDINPCYIKTQETALMFTQYLYTLQTPYVLCTFSNCIYVILKS